MRQAVYFRVAAAATCESPNPQISPSRKTPLVKYGMTELNKPIRRRARTPFSYYRKRIVVSLEPGDLIGMRLERTRKTFRAAIGDVFRQIIQWHANADPRQRKEERKLRCLGR